jgi:N-acyl-D-amino-acid deacylase
VADTGTNPDGLVLRGGLLIDGGGAPARRLDVMVRDGVVAEIGPALAADGRTSREVSGSVICPGFVDIHTHSDLTLLSAPRAPSAIQQGITTVVVGNCGLGPSPLSDTADRAAIRSAVSYLDVDAGVTWSWSRTGEYLAALEQARPAVNVAVLVGHVPLRASVCGFAERPADEGEHRAMARLLREALREGAAGVSTGLAYAPLMAADDAELIALATVAAEEDALFSWHIRSYDDDLIESVSQALRVAERTGARTQISHLTAVGARNWPRVREALALVDRARATGLSIGVDIYPYLYGNAPLAQLLPAWAQEGTPAEWQANLAQPGVAQRVLAAWVDRPVPWSEVTVSWTARPRADVVGRTLDELGAERGTDGGTMALDLLAELGTGVMMTAGGRSETELRRVLEHPASVVASDGLALDPDGPTGTGLPHPRSYGCFPRYLARYAADLPDAIRRCTSAPAQRAGLADRGLVRVGAPADLVVFDPGRLRDEATFTDPHRYPSGIELVLVAGEIVVDAGRHTGRRPGTILRRRSATSPSATSPSQEVIPS